MYIQFLANTYSAPNTFKNYMSGARNWISFHKGDDSAFASSEAAAVLSYNIKKSAHVQAQAYPISLLDLKHICEFIDISPNVPLAVKPALLIGYFAFLRVSNLLAPSLNVWTGPHNLAASDVYAHHDSIVICLRSTKTIHTGKPVLMPIYKVPNSTCCPVAAWNRYLAAVNPDPKGPAFMIDNVTPLTARPLVNVMRLALQINGNQNYHKVSMHSLRRGGAQAAEQNGASTKALMEHGTWSTPSTLKTYLNNS